MPARMTVLAVAITVLGLALRVYHIDSQELWLDEAYSFYMAVTSDFLTHARTESNPPLYYLMLRGWVTLMGDSEFMVRLPSALFGTAFIITLIWVGRAIFNPSVGLWSGAFAALTPLHIYYSQEARAYALLIWLLVLTYGFLWRAMHKRTWRAWTLCCLTATLALYTHYFALLGLVPTIFMVLLWDPPSGNKRLWLEYGITGLVSVLLFVPWLLWSVLSAVRPSNAAWITRAWELTPPALAIPKSLVVFLLGPQKSITPIIFKQLTDMQMPFTLTALGILLLVTFGIFLASPLYDRMLGIPDLGRKKVWLGVSIILPLALLWAISFLYMPVYVVGRYDIIAFTAFALLIGLALAKIHVIGNRCFRGAFLVPLLLLVPISTKLLHYYTTPGTSLAQKTAELVDQFVQTGDVVVFTGLRGLPVLYYLHKLEYDWKDKFCVHRKTGRHFACRMFPLETEQTPAVDASRRVLAKPNTVQQDVKTFLSNLATPRHDLWILIGNGGTYANGRLWVPKPDSYLLEALAQKGRHSAPVALSLDVFVFRG